MNSYDKDELYAFELGREWKLSLAEIESLFGSESVVSVTPKLAIIRSQLPVARIAGTMGWVIRAFQILSALRDIRSFPHEVAKQIRAMETEGKISFGLWTIGPRLPLFSQGLRLKKDLRDSGLSVRVVNKSDDNLAAALVKKEGLVNSGTELFLLDSWNGSGSGTSSLYLGRTIFIQDIDAYAARDLGKSRDMEIGMLPPKLAQTMINLALGSQGNSSESLKSVRLYDPFSGLGTVLIEGVHRGVAHLFASDLNPEMVRATQVNLEPLTREGRVQESYVQLLDAKEIVKMPKISEVTHIVTEGYLGRIFWQNSVRYDLVESEKRQLLAIYDCMFSGLSDMRWNGRIVMTIPCWETREASIYFWEFHTMLGTYGFRVEPLLADRPDVRLTKFWTLIYRRPGQTVGREVVRIVKG